MEFAKGIPPESRTLVVIPTMLVGDHNLKHLLEGLEIWFLANQDKNLHFGLLTDFRRRGRGDKLRGRALLRAARTGIEELNEKYIGVNGRSLLPFPSAAPVECTGAVLDGLRTQAREAFGPELACFVVRRTIVLRLSSAPLKFSPASGTSSRSIPIHSYRATRPVNV